ncbi:hypothetical protein SEUBUCD646_0B01970 [Saccharomyces eubayanus]|uniref:Protein-tyrosine-phosphatase n=2 Tax=Saccharomyces TaxID=4930 RepID=A0A6C1E3A9_SACPS|nr:OCA6-like protein [Saccharomyces eubayanus]KOH00920.1 OCA6-like protein [Saccharomyces eubayanus]QID83410.1 protein-tyrosine-phosphatase [Saccharomyces pastorianus]CAI1819405.1 hypothetical protein SEUBUCD650_0B01980 [Saccharomyces eubayanus]CAI1854628.1 hypothetical protein SEUBUCD646_0B01970 [Saccharomyces eubayanus]
MSLVTPLQFSTVQPNLYRGSYPREINFSFLRTLRLKYVLSLTPEPLDNDPQMLKFCEENNIKTIHIECQSERKTDKTKPKIKRKKKTVPIEYDVVVRCVKFLIDKRHYPCYMHCTNGELIISLVVACMRKFSYWSTVSILNEFLVYNSSINIHERNFVENFKSEIEVDNLDIKDKVPWITVRYIARAPVESKDDAQTEDANTSEKVARVSSVPNMLPKLKFHSM